MTGALPTPDLTRRHLALGWSGLAVFVAVGIALEALHGFKAGFYLDPAHETRRLLWRLAHVHGALLSVVHVAFAVTLERLPAWTDAARTLASRCLTAALALLPTGFALGGMWVHGGDPGLGILLVPPGALLLLVAVVVTARAACRRDR